MNSFCLSFKIISTSLSVFIIQFLNLISKSSIRKLWEEKPSYRDVTNTDEIESVDDFCKGIFTDYKYNVFYEFGKNDYTFTEDETLIGKNNDYNSVSRIIY